MAINLSRNTRLWVSTQDENGTHNNANTFEIPIQEDYSFSQSVTTADINIDEAGPIPTRGGKRFNNSLDPVEWNISTYINPYIGADSNHYLVDMMLWHALSHSNTIAPDFDNSTTNSEVYGTATEFNVGFANNSAHTLTQLYFYFKVDNQTYLIKKVQVGSAEISIDISDIGMINWSGQGTEQKAIADPAFMDADGSNGLDLDETTPTTDKYVAINTGKQYLINKLTELEMQASVAPDANNNYNIAITSASISINNNITYLTPNTLAELDTPIGSFTGSFEVTGSVESYLRDTGGDGTGGNPYGSSELLNHMIADRGVTNTSNIVIYLGGKTNASATITIPTGHLSVPEVSVEDVVSQSFEFKGIPTDTGLKSGDEINLTFKAQ